MVFYGYIMAYWITQKVCINLFDIFTIRIFLFLLWIWQASLHRYMDELENSIFSLCPEGDRHLDTFRLWESFSCGSIPLVVDYNSTVSKLLPNYSCVPVFTTWREACDFAISSLSCPNTLNHLQYESLSWWLNYIKDLKRRMNPSRLDLSSL